MIVSPCVDRYQETLNALMRVCNLHGRSGDEQKYIQSVSTSEDNFLDIVTLLGGMYVGSDATVGAAEHIFGRCVMLSCDNNDVVYISDNTKSMYAMYLNVGEDAVIRFAKTLQMFAHLQGHEGGMFTLSMVNEFLNVLFDPRGRHVKIRMQM